MGFQNNQDAHRQPGLLGPQSWYLREQLWRPSGTPPPSPDRATSTPAQADKHLPSLLSSLEGLYGPQPSVS